LSVSDYLEYPVQPMATTGHSEVEVEVAWWVVDAMSTVGD